MYRGACGSSPSAWRRKLTASASEVSVTNASFHTPSINSWRATTSPARSMSNSRRLSTRGGRAISTPSRQSNWFWRSNAKGPKLIRTLRSVTKSDGERVRVDARRGWLAPKVPATRSRRLGVIRGAAPEQEACDARSQQPHAGGLGRRRRGFEVEATAEAGPRSEPRYTILDPDQRPGTDKVHVEQRRLVAGKELAQSEDASRHRERHPIREPVIHRLRDHERRGGKRQGAFQERVVGLVVHEDLDRKGRSKVERTRDSAHIARTGVQRAERCAESVADEPEPVARETRAPGLTKAADGLYRHQPARHRDRVSLGNRGHQPEKNRTHRARELAVEHTHAGTSGAPPANRRASGISSTAFRTL